MLKWYRVEFCLRDSVVIIFKTIPDDMEQSLGLWFIENGFTEKQFECFDFYVLSDYFFWKTSLNFLH